MDIQDEIAAMAEELAKAPLELPNLDCVTLPMLALNYECLKIRIDELEARIKFLEEENDNSLDSGR